MAANGRGYRIGAEEAAGNQIVAAMSVPNVAATLKASTGKGGGGVGPEDTFIPTVMGFHMTQDPIPNAAVAHSLGTTSSGTMGVSVSEKQQGELREATIAPSLTKGGGKMGQGYSAARTQQGVRRLTPTECERLMAWPDGWTLDDGPSLVDAPQTWPGGPPPNDPQPDGRRYSACGDGVVAHVAEWLGLGFPQESR